MGNDIISRVTRDRFREFLVEWTLRNITMAFGAGEIDCSDEIPSVNGERRNLIERYYSTLDFYDWNDVKKILKVYEYVIEETQRLNPDKVSQMCAWLKKDGFIYDNGKILHVAGVSGIQDVKTVALDFNANYIHQEIKRIEDSVDSDTSLAIGSAKELVESCCKTILHERKVAIPTNPDIPKLVKMTLKELKLLPDDVPQQAKGADAIRRLLSNLGSIVYGLAEIRNLYGTGHGKDGSLTGIKPRHAKLAVGAATTLVVFLFETHKERAANQ